MKENLYIAKLRLSEVDEVSEILTNAFKTNPAYSIIFKNKNKMNEGLLWLFRTSLIFNNHKQALTRVIKENDTGKIIGTFSLIPPEGVKNSILTYSKIGLFSFILKFGLKSLIRMMELDACNKSALTKSIKTSEYYYLSMVVIREEYRGTGIGSYAINQIIQEFITQNPTCKLIGLTTQLSENVYFYSKLGFKKIDEGEIFFKKDKYYNYNMKYVFEKKIFQNNLRTDCGHKA